MNLILNGAYNAIFIFVLVYFGYANIAGFTGMSEFNKLKAVLILAVFSMVGVIFGLAVNFFTSLLSFRLLTVFSWLIIGWVTMAFLETLPLGFDYFEGNLLQNLIVYGLFGFFYYKAKE
jgi:hypothetical protein